MSFNTYVTDGDAEWPAEIQNNQWAAILSLNHLMLPVSQVFSKTEWLVSRRIGNHYFTQRLDPLYQKKVLPVRRHLRRLVMERVRQRAEAIEQRLRERDRTVHEQRLGERTRTYPGLIRPLRRRNFIS